MTTEPFKEPMKVEAVKSSFRQTKTGVVISFTLHTDDPYQYLAALPIGTRGVLAFAEIIE